MLHIAFILDAESGLAEITLLEITGKEQSACCLVQYFVDQVFAFRMDQVDPCSSAFFLPRNPFRGIGLLESNANHSVLTFATGTFRRVNDRTCRRISATASSGRG